MRDMGIQKVGDRIYLDTVISILRRDLQRQKQNEVFWEGQIPAAGALTLTAPWPFLKSWYGTRL